MELLQEILVMISFVVSAGYILTRFTGKPAFMKTAKKKACGVSDCGCG